MAAELTKLTHKITIQLHLVTESCTIYSSRSRRPVQKVLDTPSYVQFSDVWTRFVNVKLPLYFNWAPHHEGILGNGGEWSASRPGRFTSRDKAPGTHWIGGWVGSRAGLDAMRNRKLPSSYRDSKYKSSSPQPSTVPLSYPWKRLWRGYRSIMQRYVKSCLMQFICHSTLLCHLCTQLNICYWGKHSFNKSFRWNYNRSRGSSVSTVTKLRAGWPGFDSWQGQIIFLFATASRPALGPIQPLVQLILGALFRWIKRLGSRADHSPLSLAQVKNNWSYTSTPPYFFMVWYSVMYRIHLDGVVLS
jgi:hypothetical protein